VLFEGWCVGTPAQSEHDLLTPINQLEADEDKQGVWRTFVNARLANEYHSLFEFMDKLVLLQAPSFETVFQWRLAQERQTFMPNPEQAMNKQQLQRFMAHYQRLTQHSLDKLPNKTDVVLRLDDKHQIVSSAYI